MSCHQCSIMLVQLQGYIIADIQIHYNIILMYDCNVYQGISFPPQFPDGLVRSPRPGITTWKSRLLCLGISRGQGNPQGSGVRVFRGQGGGCEFLTPGPIQQNPWHPWQPVTCDQIYCHTLQLLVQLLLLAVSLCLLMTMLQTLTTVQCSTFNVQPLNYHCDHNVSPLLLPLILTASLTGRDITHTHSCTCTV